MVITKTPYRISFFGGGSDFPAFYENYRGAVLNCTIDKFSYIQCRNLPPHFDHKYRIRCFQTERVNSIDEIKHPSVRETLRFCNYPFGVEILHSGDLPPMSGVGSSSSFTVGLLLAIRSLQGILSTKRQLALDSIEIEQNLIKENVGSQDQYAAAFGGFNRIDFGPGEKAYVTPITIKKETLDYLQKNLLFVYSGISRFSSQIQENFINNIHINISQLSDIVSLVDEAQSLLNGADESHIDNFGRLLDTAWQIKRRFSKNISNVVIDEIYTKAMRSGALGGKICGAGGGGFMMFYAPQDSHAYLRKALNDFLIVPIRIVSSCAHVIFYSQKDDEQCI